MFLTICIVCLSLLGGLLVQVHYAAIAVETVTAKVTVQKTDDLARKVQHLNVFNRWYGRMPKGKATVHPGKLYSIGGDK